MRLSRGSERPRRMEGWGREGRQRREEQEGQVRLGVQGQGKTGASSGRNERDGQGWPMSEMVDSGW